MDSKYDSDEFDDLEPPKPFDKRLLILIGGIAAILSLAAWGCGISVCSIWGIIDNQTFDRLAMTTIAGVVTMVAAAFLICWLFGAYKHFTKEEKA